MQVFIHPSAGTTCHVTSKFPCNDLSRFGSPVTIQLPQLTKPSRYPPELVNPHLLLLLNGTSAVHTHLNSCSQPSRRRLMAELCAAFREWQERLPCPRGDRTKPRPSATAAPFSFQDQGLIIPFQVSCVVVMKIRRLWRPAETRLMRRSSLHHHSQPPTTTLTAPTTFTSFSMAGLR